MNSKLRNILLVFFTTLTVVSLTIRKTERKVQAQSTPTTGNLKYCGAFKLKGNPYGSFQTIAYASSLGTWIGIQNRTNLGHIYMFHSPDDTSNYQPDTTSVNNGCVASASLDSTCQIADATHHTNMFVDQAKGCNVTNTNVATYDWGTPLNSISGISLTGSNAWEIYGSYWDNSLSLLYVSLGNIYSCDQPGDNYQLVALSFGTNPPTAYGPWLFKDRDLGTEMNCSTVQRSFKSAPAFFTADTTTAMLDARGCPGTGSGASRRDACNAAGIKNMWASGEKGSGDNGNTPWGYNLYTCDKPTSSTPASIYGSLGTYVDCKNLIAFYALGNNITDDLGVTHNGILQTSSRVLRRDPYGVIIGKHATNSIAGNPLDCDVPYGRYWTDQTAGIGSSDQHAGEGWAPGIDNSGDIAAHWAAIDEADFNGLLYFGQYSIGYSWYGVGVAYSDDTNAFVPTSACGTSSTGFVAFDGINSSNNGLTYIAISAVDIANPTTIHTGATPHGLTQGDSVWVVNSDAVPQLSGPYTVGTVGTSTTFQINVNVTGAGTAKGYIAKLTGPYTGRFMESIDFPKEAGGSDTCTPQSGPPNSNTRVGVNPCRYIYGRRAGGKGYISEYTVPGLWTISFGAISQSIQRTYVSRTGVSLNVDHSDFQVLNAPGNLNRNLNPVYSNYQYNDKQNRYDKKTPQNYNVNEVYFRPTTLPEGGSPTGTIRRIYVMSDGNQPTPYQVVNVFQLSTSCSASAPTAPSTVSAAATGSDTIQVSWAGDSTNQVSLNLLQCQGTGCSSFSPTISGLPAGAVSQQVTGLAANTSYTFKVQAVNTCGAAVTSSASATATTRPLNAPPGGGKMRFLFRR